ncbi:hypothetical protein SLS58_010624 [Diplodia intermedia]|uniref:Uncharacterized protein n=1 Tax=Diplodia intermedia TaxID=856260 RepID=A0ABR3T4W7_9PEZI
MREDGERRAVEWVWQNVLDARNHQDQPDFREWVETVDFYTDQMRHRATYIEAMDEHRAPQRARYLRDAADRMRAYRDVRRRYFQQPAAPRPQEVHVEERGGPSIPEEGRRRKSETGAQREGSGQMADEEEEERKTERPWAWRRDTKGS